MESDFKNLFHLYSRLLELAPFFSTYGHDAIFEHINFALDFTTDYRMQSTALKRGFSEQEEIYGREQFSSEREQTIDLLSVV